MLSSTQASPTQPVYHKTTGTEEDGVERLHAPLNRTALYSSHGSMTIAEQAQNKVLIDRDVSIMVCTLYFYLHVSHFKRFWTFSFSFRTYYCWCHFNIVPSLVPGFKTTNTKEVREGFPVNVQDIQQTPDCYCWCCQRNKRSRRRRKKRVILREVPMKLWRLATNLHHWCSVFH